MDFQSYTHVSTCVKDGNRVRWSNFTDMITLAFVFSAFIAVSSAQRDNSKFGCSMEIVVTPGVKDKLAQHLADRHQGWDKLPERDQRVHVQIRVRNLVEAMISHTNQILDSTDFGGGRAINIFAKRIRILDEETCNLNGVDYCKQHDSLLDLLKDHSYVNHDEFCLSYVLTDIQDSEGHLGKAFVSDPEKKSGGICDPFSPRVVAFDDDYNVENVVYDETKPVSLNTGVVTLTHLTSGLMSERSLASVFAHEIGHSLGSRHDTVHEDRGACYFDEFGVSYLMHPSVVRGINTDSVEKFSRCSIRNISRAIDGAQTCLTQGISPICGNGIVEAWEECDCGHNDSECLESCCNPASSGTQGCTLKQGSKCSPSEGPCCNLNCTFIGPFDYQRVCLQPQECHSESICDGKRPHCPAAHPYRDGKECAQGTKVCSNGQCSKSICSKYNMVPCQKLPKSPTDLDFMPSCEIRCRPQKSSRRQCLATSEMPTLFAEARYYKNQESCLASPLLDFGYCNTNGLCSDLRSAVLSASGADIGIAIAIIILILILLNLMVFMYCRYCRGRSIVVQ